LRGFTLLFRLRAQEVLRARSSALFFFALPLVLLAALAVTFSGGHPFERRRVALVGPAPGTRLPSEVLLVPARDQAHARRWLATRTLDAVLITQATPPRVLTGPRGRLLAEGLAGRIPGAAITVVPVPRWGYVHYLFPGLLAFTVLTSGLFGVGGTLLRDRESRFLRKLSLTPLPRAVFVAAQVASRGTLILGQSALLVLSAWWCFDLPLTPLRALGLLAVSACGLVVFLGLGFALACLLRTEALLVDALSALTTPLVLLSEAFYPVSELPRPLATVAVFLPSTQLVRLGRAVLLDPALGFQALAPGMAVLGAWALLGFALGVGFFRWTDAE
jgi:ABC-type polysaccharide/polyol phosphate export permease